MGRALLGPIPLELMLFSHSRAAFDKDYNSDKRKTIPSVRSACDRVNSVGLIVFIASLVQKTVVESLSPVALIPLPPTYQSSKEEAITFDRRIRFGCCN